MEALGIDIGGSGIKGAPVNITTGKLLAPRFRLTTPKPSTPPAVAETIKVICGKFNWSGLVGCGFPAAIQHGIVRTAANVDDSWINTQGETLFAKATGLQVKLTNDADAAGMAEIEFGAGKGKTGVIFIITIGTGIGTALFVDGNLVPNTELGHIRMKGMDAEFWTSDSARKREGLTWRRWAKRFNRYLNYLDALFWPDLFIVGGGAAKKHEKFLPLLHTRCPVVPAKFHNNAGIVGAALTTRALHRGSK